MHILIILPLMIRQDPQMELLPLVDESGNVTGKATRKECHSPAKPLHPVVHLHVFNSKGEIYLQKRPMWKDIQPGRWDTAVGGHISYGEDIKESLARESLEELGITAFTPVHAGSYIFESERERELVHVYLTVYDGPIAPSDELDGGRFWSMDEVNAAMGKGIFTPNFESELARFDFFRNLIVKQYSILQKLLP